MLLCCSYGCRTVIISLLFTEHIQSAAEITPTFQKSMWGPQSRQWDVVRSVR
jgi:hypothetical protein